MKNSCRMVVLAVLTAAMLCLAGATTASAIGPVTGVSLTAAVAATVTMPVMPVVIDRRCPPGSRWAREWRRCVRWGRRRCPPGWHYARRWRRCVRWGARRCPPGWHYSRRWHRCVRW
ncbi:MAG: hypothetical protein KJ621_00080 [Proteobacteria bacterium]|nr:hypothetical protein [Pseudomonadota bacterium]MBU1740953.1 hypothetical protein [Pseudomonadota bacterium]